LYSYQIKCGLMYMNVLIYFGGTGDDYKYPRKGGGLEEDAPRFLYEKFEFNENKNLSMDNINRVIMVDGIAPHTLGGANTKATPYLSNMIKNIFPNLEGKRNACTAQNGVNLFIITDGDITEKSNFRKCTPDEFWGDSILDRHNLYLTGFSRGSVMTFVFAKLLHELSSHRYSIYIAAIEPVSGNQTQLNIGTFYHHAKSMHECSMVKRCVVALGTYHGKAPTIYNQMCPLPIGTNAPPNIRPFIFHKQGHLSHCDKESQDSLANGLVLHISFHYAGFPLKNALTKETLDKKYKAFYQFLGCSSSNITFGGRIYNLTGDGKRYSIQKQSPDTTDALIKQLDRLLKITEINNSEVVYRYASQRILVACYLYKEKNKEKKSGNGYIRVETLEGKLKELANDKKTDEKDKLGKIDSIMRDYIVHNRVGGMTFSGETLNSGSNSFGFFLIEALSSGVREMNDHKDNLEKMSSSIGRFISDLVAQGQKNTSGTTGVTLLIRKLKDRYKERPEKPM